MTEPTDIDLAAYALHEAKRAEDQAREARIAAEQHLVDLVGLKEEGTTTVKTDFYQVSTTGKLNRKLNATADMPDGLHHEITRVKHELDVVKLKKLATENPIRYQEACKWIVSTPAKPSAKVELLQQSQEVA